MKNRTLLIASSVLGTLTLCSGSARAEGDLRKLNHVIIVMQENHSFDNYFGALPYVPGGPYHGPRQNNEEGENGSRGCRARDHACVDGLTCTVDVVGNLTCTNSNVESDGSIVHSFHDSRY